MTGRGAPILLAAALLAPGLGSCGVGGDESGEDPSVSFVRPEDGASTGATVTAEVEAERFDAGEFHFSLDGGRFDDPAHAGADGRRAFRLGTDGQYSPSRKPEITYTDLPPGEHTLRVELARDDHSELGVSDEISFTVE